MINAFVLAPMSGKNICSIQCLLLLCHENAVSKEPGPAWYRAACAWLGSAPLPGAPESCPGLMWQLCVGDTVLILYFALPFAPGGTLLCQMADVVQDIQD